MPPLMVINVSCGQPPPPLPSLPVMAIKVLPPINAQVLRVQVLWHNLLVVVMLFALDIMYVIFHPLAGDWH